MGLGLEDGPGEGAADGPREVSLSRSQHHLMHSEGGACENIVDVEHRTGFVGRALQLLHHVSMTFSPRELAEALSFFASGNGPAVLIVQRSDLAVFRHFCARRSGGRGGDLVPVDLELGRGIHLGVVTDALHEIATPDGFALLVSAAPALLDVGLIAGNATDARRRQLGVINVLEGLVADLIGRGVHVLVGHVHVHFLGGGVASRLGVVAALEGRADAFGLDFSSSDNCHSGHQIGHGKILVF